MSECPNCGTPLTRPFCSSCGAPAPGSAEATTIETATTETLTTEAPATDAVDTTVAAALDDEAAAAEPTCPSAETLERAFEDSNLAKAIVLGDGFVDIECAGSWGRAMATPDPNQYDPAQVYFRIECCPETPVFVDAGTGIDCTEFIDPNERAYREFCAG